MSGLESLAAEPGRFRRIRLATGAEIDLENVGPPELALFDESHDLGARAECLFPGCLAVGAIELILCRNERGTRWARHRAGEGGRRHDVYASTSPEHVALADLWRDRLEHAGARTEASHARDGRVIRRDDVYAPSGVIPLDIEIQLSSRTVASAARRDRDIESFGVMPVWDLGPAVDLKGRVASLRLPSDIGWLLDHRDPASAERIGVQNLVPYQELGQWKLARQPRRMRWAEIAEGLASGSIATVAGQKIRTLAPADQAERYRDLLKRDSGPSERTRRPRGELRRHVELAPFAPQPEQTLTQVRPAPTAGRCPRCSEPWKRPLGPGRPRQLVETVGGPCCSGCAHLPGHGTTR